jgi:membrane associated rhomboid family serine protease
VIPLRDNNPTYRIPHVTYVLIAVNVLVYLYEVTIGSMHRPPSREFAIFIVTYGATPSHIVSVLLHPGQWFFYPMGTLVTSMFIHGGFWHLAGNMLFLYIFGDNIEDALGHVRFLIFYLLCGIAASAAHVGIDLVEALLGLSPVSSIPMVGASGAIGGIMGGYILLYPRARVLSLVFFFFITIIEIPALWFLGGWLVLQFLGGLNNIGAGNVGGTAFWAHIGGFLMGMWLIRLWMKSNRYRDRPQIWWE